LPRPAARVRAARCVGTHATQHSEAGVQTIQSTHALSRRRAEASRRAIQGASIALLVAGAGLRLRQYFAHRALWLDELLLALNVVHRSYGGLLRPLDSNQGAPVGWLWAEKTMVEIFGNHDTTLRLMPLVVSLASLVLFFLFVRRWLAGPAEVLACALFAFAPDLINYAVQVKQYGTDVFFVLVVLLMSTRVNDEPTVRRIAQWAVTSIVAMWCSHAAAIALAACTLVLLARLVFTGRAWTRIRPLVVASIALLASFATEYVVNLRALSRNQVLLNYWTRGSPPKPFGISRDAVWLWQALVFLMTNPFGFARPAFALVLVAVGMVLFVARRGADALIIVAPVGAAILASLVGKYPLHERLSLYLAPCIFISLAALVDLRFRAHLAPFATVGLVAVLVVAAAPIGRGASVAWAPTDVTDSRGPFAFVAARRQPGDLLYVENPWARPAYQYYGSQYHLVADGTFGIVSVPGPCIVTRRVGGLRDHHRVWFVLTHRSSNEPVDRNAIYRSYFAAIGWPVAAFDGAGQAGAYLYEVGNAPGPVRPRPTWLAHGCIWMSRLGPVS
jgi:Dolichyl-phosphate-mannose-protein mannosyltransferase